MRSNFLARSRRWIGASALAILVGLGGGTAFLAASSPMAAAQVTPAAQITTPDLTAQNPGFADLVAAVKPAVVSINGSATSAAVTMFLTAVTGLTSDVRHLVGKPLDGVVRAAVGKPAPGCVVCSTDNAFGRADSWPLMWTK